MSTYPNAHANIKKWILEVQFPGNRLGFSIIRNDFGSATMWAFQIPVSFSEFFLFSQFLEHYCNDMFTGVSLSLMSWSILKPTFSTDRQPFVGFVSVSTGVEDSKLSLTSINRSEILVFPPGLTQTNMHFYQ